MRTLICTQLFLFTSVSSLFLGCEQQDPPARAAGDGMMFAAEHNHRLAAQAAGESMMVRNSSIERPPCQS